MHWHTTESARLHGMMVDQHGPVLCVRIAASLSHMTSSGSVSCCRCVADLSAVVRHRGGARGG